jgi:hypothetical protein
MLKNNRAWILVLAVIGIGFAIYYYKNQLTDMVAISPVPPQASPALSEIKSSNAAAHYPVPSEGASNSGASPAPGTASLPDLDASDETLQDALAQLLGKDSFNSLFTHTGLVRKMVISVDNAAAEHPLSSETSVFLPLEGKFKTGKGQELTLSPSNYSRYQPYIAVARAIDPEKMVSVYFHFYPLFQSAYRDINPKKYFNDRLVEVIDKLLETPEVSDPIKLTIESVRYKFADPKIESLTVGQKLLVHPKE